MKMKKMLKNSKGFTLVELLAVIVVLAVIILIAMPAVMSSMDKARRNALITEANEIAKVAQTAFADDSLTSGISAICYDLEYLVNEGYLDKNTSGYHGEVYLQVDSAGKVTTTIALDNGIYSVSGDPKTLTNEAKTFMSERLKGDCVEKKPFGTGVSYKKCIGNKAGCTAS